MDEDILGAKLEVANKRRRPNLTEKEVVAIREQYRDKVDANYLCKVYGVSKSRLQGIVTGVSYQKMGGPITEWRPGFYTREFKPGDRYGSWEVVRMIYGKEREPQNRLKGSVVLVRCDCGAERQVRGYFLYKGYSQKCKTCSVTAPRDARKSKYVGHKKGALTCIDTDKEKFREYRKETGRTCTFTILQCDCGNKLTIPLSHFLQDCGKKDCGCGLGEFSRDWEQ